MKLLRPRKMPAVGLHKASGQARMTVNGKSVYLGAPGSEECNNKYNINIYSWINGGLGEGWAPQGWRPADTGHQDAGVPTIEDLVGCFRRHLVGTLGSSWQRKRVPIPVRVEGRKGARV